MPETHSILRIEKCENVLQTSKESDLKATNQEQTEEKYVTNDSNRSGQPAQGRKLRRYSVDFHADTRAAARAPF